MSTKLTAKLLPEPLQDLIRFPHWSQISKQAHLEDALTLIMLVLLPHDCTQMVY